MVCKVEEKRFHDLATPRTGIEDKQVDITDNREIRAWYLYDFANGAFFYSAMNFLPLMITAQAREYAKTSFCGMCKQNEWAEDFENKGLCDDRRYETNSTCLSAGATWSASLNSQAKFVHFFGLPVGYASFTQYCVSLSVILQLAIFVTMGSFADYGPNRKKMFFVCNTIGISSLALVFLAPQDSLYWVNGVFFIISIVAFSFCIVFYNSYLPLLAVSHPDVSLAIECGNTSEEVKTIEKEITHNLSLKGFAIGFCGQLIFLLLNLVILVLVTDDSYLNTRLSIVGTSVWILAFSGITFYYLKKRPGPPLPRGESYCKHSLYSCISTIKSFKHLRQLKKFLIAYFVFSDGTSTLAQSAAVFAQEELYMSTFKIGLALIEVSVCAVIGCVIFKWLHETKGISSKRILIINLAMMGLIPLCGLFFIHTEWEFFLGIFFFGINTGSQQAFTRSIFAFNIPDGKEAEYFSFYEISDKGTAWLGPLVVGLIFQTTGSYRNAFGALIVFFVLGIGLLTLFDSDLAKKEKKIFDLKNTEL